ncbi:hypothetical protein [Gemmobacter sp. 24YEA27]|uniref:hypothetical protein n=1 Tax=Gemmobacter sp. 24YEA27 TaxID=3040672 RepID=UPI0024B39BED|nr:hypothetical protein [Gemmobacter sp. 24YEA27]
MSFPACSAPRRLAAGLFVAALFAGQAVGPLAAEEAKGPNITTGASGAAGAVATLALAQELFGLGRSHGDALTVLAAARLAASAEVSPGKEFKRSTSGEGEAGPDAASAPADAGAMFDLALTLAAQDEFLTDVILEAQTATARGRIGGAFSQRASLAAGRTDNWEIPFTGGAYAELAVLGNGTSDLDIMVTDETGNVICYEGGQEDRLYCDFVPSWDGFFFVAVENKGAAAAAYDLVTN